MLLAEGGHFPRVLGDQRLRHQVGKFGDEDLLRAVAHPDRIVDDQRLRMDALEHMRGGDVVHVEGRVLPEQDHVHLLEVGADRLAEGEMVALLVAHRHLLDAGENLAAEHGQPVGRIVEKRVAAALRLQRQREAGVAGNRHGRDVVHLDGDFQRHGASPGGSTPAI